MDTPKIVVVMIVKNESECLAKCLDSVRDADNIYIVDTGSEDNTVEIAKKYTDNVYEDYKWNDSFCEARNHALSKVKEENTYVLSIDADEYCHDFSKVREAVIEADKIKALAVDVKLYSEKDKQLHYYPRMFKKDPKVWWEGAVHNHISEKPTYTSEIEITYGYSPAHLKDPGRALRILEKEVKRTGNAREVFYLGREYWYRSDFVNCIKTMEDYITKAHFLAEKADAFLILARCYWAQGKPDEARLNCLNAITLNPNFKEAVLFMSKLAGRGTGNPVWEKNAIQWERMAATADNSGVLFIRNE